MARSHYTYKKRMKELKRMEKAEKKRQKRLAKKMLDAEEVIDEEDDSIEDEEE